MNTEQFIKQLQLQLHKHMFTRHKCMVIFADSNADAPKKPYATLKVSYVQPETFNERNDKVYVEVDNIHGLQKGWHKRRMVFEQIRISVTVYDKGDDYGVNLHSITLVNHIQDWFSVYSERLMEQADAALLSVGEPTDRSVHIADSYDYKMGFDVDIRRTRSKFDVPLYQEGTSEYNYDIIDTVIVTNERTGEEITTKLEGGDKRA